MKREEKRREIQEKRDFRNLIREEMTRNGTEDLENAEKREKA